MNSFLLWNKFHNTTSNVPSNDLRANLEWEHQMVGRLPDIASFRW